ncbi:hypothetical protein IAU59_006527 [Kwoniella sp. CBS 9459]
MPKHRKTRRKGAHPTPTPQLEAQRSSEPSSQPSENEGDLGVAGSDPGAGASVAGPAAPEVVTLAHPLRVAIVEPIGASVTFFVLSAEKDLRSVHAVHHLLSALSMLGPFAALGSIVVVTSKPVLTRRDVEELKDTLTIIAQLLEKQQCP